MAVKDVLRKIYNGLPSPPSTNFAFRSEPVNPYALLPPAAVIFDIGSKDSRGKYVFGAPPAGARLVCVDISPGEGVDIVADAHNLDMVENDYADCVIAVDILQHIKHPHIAIAEFYRILKPGGVLYVSAPFIFPFHTDPYDFHRFSYDGLAVLCDQFERLESGFNRGPASTFTHMLVHFLALAFSFNSGALHSLNVYVFTWLLFWLKYFDVFLAKFKMAKFVHTAAFFLGRKPAVSAAD